MILSFPKSYVAFDLETTGLDVLTADIVEIGAKKVIRDLDGKVTSEESKTWLLTGDRPSCPEALAAHGITEEMRASGIPPKQAILELCEFSRGLPFVGHKLLSYDIPLLTNVMRRNGIERVALSYQFENAVDTAALFKGSRLDELVVGRKGQWHTETHAQYAWRVLETKVSGLKFNLKYCCEELRVDTSNIVAHRAAGDVEMVDRIYRKMLGL